MEALKKLEYLEGELSESATGVNRLRRRYRSAGFALKIVSVAFSAAITVLLGLRGMADMADTFANIALLLSALITVFGAVEAFFGYRSLWIQKQIIWMELEELRRRITFYKTGMAAEDEVEMTQVDWFMKEFNRIMRKDLKEWLQLREDDLPQEKEDADNP